MTLERFLLVVLTALVVAVIATALTLSATASWPGALLAGGGGFGATLFGGFEMLSKVP
ncbi:hypothetical protein [Planomonospora sp. ID82291]|uniref:hypothetical protein n=1 Tax=Planomonospora sp. ID82291 TaxID=2738136 RepID=UPI0018C3D3E5|nr:hypothetical protein [Planomonospora sp. ID82291]MBG0819058.1 hypothetical protein [Planomonospora sp. ID82291]